MDELKPSFFLLAALLLVANGFFVAVEFALVSLRRTKIEELIRDGHRGALHVKQMLQNLDEYLSSCQVGITLASLALGWIGERTFAALFTELFRWTGLTDALGRIGIEAETGSWITAHTLAIIVAMVALTFLHVVLGEQAPKIFALQVPETIALWVVWPMRICNRVFYPLVWLVNTSTRRTLKSLGLKPVPAHARAHSEEELGMILDESKLAGVVSPEERKMLERVFRFHDKTVKEIMVPRPDVIALNIRANEKDAIKQVFESGYSRVPVYDGSLDKIAGILYVKDLLYTMQHPNLIKIPDLLREVQEIPESYSLSQLLRDFQRRRVHMAIVVDEFGATSGLVTLEDIIEEIVGEIRDEHDQEPEDIVKLPDGTFMVESTTHLDLFTDTFPGIELPDEDFDTVGGLVLHLAGRLPREGDSFRLGDLVIRVVKREGRRIRRVLVLRGPPGATLQLASVRPPGERKDAPSAVKKDGSPPPPPDHASTTP